MCSLWNFIESEIIAAAATIETAVRNGEQMDSCANLHLWDKYWKDWIVLIISIIIQGTVIEVTTTTAITIRHTDRQTWESCASQRGERLNETEHNNNSKKIEIKVVVWGWWWSASMVRACHLMPWTQWGCSTVANRINWSARMNWCTNEHKSRYGKDTWRMKIPIEMINFSNYIHKSDKTQQQYIQP